MCQSKANGGRRCNGSKSHPAPNDIRSWLTRDSDASARLLEAREKYGPIVTRIDIPIPERLAPLVETMGKCGVPLLVGGTVRDYMKGIEPKDYDFEVHGTSMDSLARVLRSDGFHVDEVGQAFGVLKVRVGDDDVDISIPRRDSLEGAGHRGISVETDQDMGVVEATSRRDYTFNSMMYDPQYGALIDPFHGKQALEQGVLSRVSEAFGEDPLRPLRGVQFAARYNMTFDAETAAVCRDLSARAGELPVERIRGEWGKFYEKGEYPSAGLKALKDSGWDSTIPAFEKINGTAMDLARQNGGRTVMMAAVAARDMDDRDAREFMRRTINGDDTARKAYLLSRTRAPESNDRATIRRWARDLGRKNLTIQDWVTREKAFATTSPEVDTQVALFIGAAAAREGVYDERPMNLVSGDDILEVFADNTPGPWVGALLKKAEAAQDESEFLNREDALAWLNSQR